MGKLGAAWLALLLASACGGTDPSDNPDGGVEPIDPCNPRDLVGVCPPRGVYDAPVAVELRGPDEDDAIRYTLDGSEPTEGSLLYNGDLTLSPDPAVGGVVVLRATAYHSDGSRTVSVTHSYVFPEAVLTQSAAPTGYPTTWGFGGDTREGDYEMDSRAFSDDVERQEALAALASAPTVALTLDHDDLWAPSSGIYMRPSAQGPDWERPGTAEILFPDGTSVASAAGVSIQGGSSTTNWKSAKLSLRVKFRGEHGDGDLTGEVFDDSDVNRFANLVLDAHLNNTWLHPDAIQRDRALYAQDQFVGRLLSEVGALAPSTRPVHLYLNGLYWGLYDLHERPDEHFAAAHLGGSPDDYDVLRHDSTTVVAGDTVGWDAMFALARAGLDDAGRYQEIATYLDVDNLIDYMLVNFYVGNSDWDHHNWYSARNRTGGGFQFFTWDAEHVIADVNIDVTAVNNTGAPSELFTALLANDDFRATLTARAAELYGPGGALYVDPSNPSWDPEEPERNQPARVFTELTEPLTSHMLLESARWGDNRAPAAPYLRADWVSYSADRLSNFFPARSQIAAAQLPSP